VEVCICFETDSHYVAQAGLELMVLLLNLPNVRIADVGHYTWLREFLVTL
jgi:hypothetical protein